VDEQHAGDVVIARLLFLHDFKIISKGMTKIQKQQLRDSRRPNSLRRATFGIRNCALNRHRQLNRLCQLN
jgi:hypothetical protein